MPAFNFDLFSPSELLGEDPRMAFFSFQDRFGKAPRQRRFFEDFFPQAENEFMGGLGQQLRGGQIPTLQFTDFLENFPFDQRFQSLPPGMRGALSGRFAPPTRFFFR